MNDDHLEIPKWLVIATAFCQSAAFAVLTVWDMITGKTNDVLAVLLGIALLCGFCAVAFLVVCWLAGPQEAETNVEPEPRLSPVPRAVGVAAAPASVPASASTPSPPPTPAAPKPAKEAEPAEAAEPVVRAEPPGRPEVPPGFRYLPGGKTPRPRRVHCAADVPIHDVLQLRTKGITTTSAVDAKLGDATEEANLEYAATRRSVLVSGSIDYEILHGTGSAHTGVLLIPEGATADQIAEVINLLTGKAVRPC